MLSLLNSLITLLTSLGLKPEQLQRFAASPWTLAAAAIATAVGVLFSRYKITPLEVLLYLARVIVMLAGRLRGRTTIVLYVDVARQSHVSHNIVRCLAAREAIAGRHRFTIVSSGDGLVRTPLAPWLVRAVVLIVTDVTKLSNEEKRRTLIQRRLVRFCHRGGVLILSHDVLYRRTRNTLLQDLAGGRITSFRAMTSPVGYVRCEGGPRCAVSPFGAATALPARFALDDKEVVYGSWAADVEFLYVWQDDPEKPLVTRRRTAAGTVFFMNAGDTDAAGPPESVSRPSPEFVALLSAMIADG